MNLNKMTQLERIQYINYEHYLLDIKLKDVTLTKEQREQLIIEFTNKADFLKPLIIILKNLKDAKIALKNSDVVSNITSCNNHVYSQRKKDAIMFHENLSNEIRKDAEDSQQDHENEIDILELELVNNTTLNVAEKKDMNDEINALYEKIEYTRAVKLNLYICSTFY